jgi:hypothetical protein
MEGGEIEVPLPFGSNAKETKKQRGPLKHQ